MSAVLRVAAAALILSGIALVIDVRAVWRLFDLRLLTAVILIQPAMAAAWLFAGWRFALLIPGRRPGILRACKALLLANGLNLVVPARIGEIVKATYLREHTGIPVEHGVAAIVTEKLQDFAVISAIGLVALGMLGLAGNPRIAIAAAAIGTIAVALLVVFRTRWERLLAALPKSLEIRLAPPLAGVASAMRDHRFWPALGAAAAVWALNFSGGWVLVSYQQIGELSLPQFAGLFSATLLAGAIPGLPGGFGAYEAAAVLVLTGFGFTPEAAFALGLTLHLGQIILGVLLAGAIAATESTGVAGLIRAATAAKGTATLQEPDGS